MIIYKTNRLQARQATTADAEFILKLLNEPAWHQFIANHSIDTLEKASDYIQQKLLASYANFGFGLWVIEKSDGATPIGLCGLLKRESLEILDIGFAFLSRYRHQGFASEAAIETMNYAKHTLKQDSVAAITDPLNKSSIKLLENIGFKYLSTFSHPGSDKILSLYVKTQY